MPNHSSLPSNTHETDQPKISGQSTCTRSTSAVLDKKWLIAGVLLVAATIIGVILNVMSHDNSPSDITGLVAIDNGDLKVNWDRYSTTDITLTDSITITESGIYHLTGSIPNGSITVDSGTTGEVKLILDNVSVNNSAGPAISCISGDEIVIELVGDNTIADGTNYAPDLDTDITGAIYSKADLTFGGDGSLTVMANYQDAIVGKDDVKFTGGTYSIIAADDGIRGKDSVYIVNGDFDITANSDAIKSTNDSDADKGFILVEGGDITIAAGDDAIHAEHVLTVQTGTINITKSYEGLEATKIIINGGDITISASDDGINAGNSSDTTSPSGPLQADDNCEIIINDGNIYVNSSGDGIDSNGWLYFNGGRVVVDGPTNNGNGALDAGSGIIINGGTVVAVGSSGMAESLGNTSSVFSLNIYFSAQQSAGTRLEVRDSAGNTIIAHTAAKVFSHAAIGSIDFSLGNTYSIYVNDNKYQDFTISDTVTTIGSQYTNTNMMPGPGKR